MNEALINITIPGNPDMRIVVWMFAAIIGLAALPGSAGAQVVMMQSPLQSNGSSFYEHSHIGWSIHNPHYFMNFNGGGGAPPFGGYQPNAGLNGGFAVNGNPFNFSFGQGASIYSTSSTPVLTTTSGYPGYIFVGRDRPFVTGVAPVVGGGFASVPPVGPLQARMATGQLRTEQGRIVPPEIPLDQLPRAPLPAAGQARNALPPAPTPDNPSKKSGDLTAAEQLERGAAAEKDGRPGVAKIYYQLAATKGDAIIKAEAARRLENLKTGAPK